MLKGSHLKTEVFNAVKTWVEKVMGEHTEWESSRKIEDAQAAATSAPHVHEDVGCLRPSTHAADTLGIHAVPASKGGGAGVASVAAARVAAATIGTACANDVDDDDDFWTAGWRKRVDACLDEGGGVALYADVLKIFPRRPPKGTHFTFISTVYDTCGAGKDMVVKRKTNFDSTGVCLGKAHADARQEFATVNPGHATSFFCFTSFRRR